MKRAKRAAPKDGPNSLTENQQIELVRKDPMAIQLIKDPSEAVLLAAVEVDGWSIFACHDDDVKRDVSDQVKLTAVKTSPDIVLTLFIGILEEQRECHVRSKRNEGKSPDEQLQMLANDIWKGTA